MKKNIIYCLVISANLLCHSDIDFDESLGKNDSYMKEYYAYLFKEISNKEHFQYLLPFTGYDLYKCCKESYIRLSPSKLHPDTKPRIPLVVHQIWLGKPLPNKYKIWQKTWQSLKGWSYRLWTDADVESFNLTNKEQFDREKNLGARADIFRIEILYRYGGLYVDTDFELLNDEFFQFLHHTYDFYTGLTPIDSFKHWGLFVIANGIIGAAPGHPILKGYIENLRHQNVRAETVTKGPGFFSKMILAYANQPGYRDIVFPPTFFYPVGNMQMNTKEYLEIGNFGKKLAALKKNCCRSESAAIHWWEGSWELPDAWIS